jgi:hypothetical protein
MLTFLQQTEPSLSWLTTSYANCLCTRIVLEEKSTSHWAALVNAIMKGTKDNEIHQV